ncbi:MAG: molybdenum cofactor guanylyltransferase [bacterium]|nr:molybdenum cofactor guanylyltransferase [bacterium]
MKNRKNVNNNISFAVLTGGLSTRFGQNKLTFKIDEKSILDTVLDLIPPHFPLYIIGEKYTDKDVTAFKDIIPGLGPIGGIYTALKKIDSNYLFILGGDMPFISQGLLDAMIGLISKPGSDVIVPINKGFYEPLFAIYSKKVENTAAEQVQKGEYKISDLFEKLKVLKVEEDFWRIHDSSGESFININRIEDLNKLNEFYKKCSH